MKSINSTAYRTILVSVMSCAFTSVVSANCAPGEEPNLATTITQDQIKGENIALPDLIQAGRQVFSTPFNACDGLGDDPVDPGNPLSVSGRPTLQANLIQGNGHFLRVNGLDSQTCLECHSVLSSKSIPATFEVGGVGGVAANAFAASTVIDPADQQNNNFAAYNGRFINPPFVFGSGGVELVAKEMTENLQKIRDEAKLSPGTWFDLVTHGVSFGQIAWEGLSAQPAGTQLRPFGTPPSGYGDSTTNCSPIERNPNNEVATTRFIAISPESSVNPIVVQPPVIPGGRQPTFPFLRLNTSRITGVDADLVVRPFGRKGNNVTTRDFDCGAVRFHLGIEPVEIVGAGNDHDQDGVTDEISIGEMSALAIFNTTRRPPCQEDYSDTSASLFSTTGCAGCHVPVIDTAQVELPYQFPENPTRPFDADSTYYTVDLSQVPVNFQKNDTGGISVPLFSDLKRYDMGPALEETLNSATQAENRSFITARLWGVADTAPYMHDGRATTLTEAIDWHEGEAEQARNNFFALSDENKHALLDFLRSLRTPGSGSCS